MGKLTKEEKKALKEAKKQQKLFEAEMARRQREMDNLERELGYTRRSQHLMNKKFRDELMKIAIKNFRENAETAWKQFNKAIDCKDYAISLKLEEVDESSEQHMTNFTGHAEQIDKFLHLLRRRIGDLRQQYQDDLHALTTMSAEMLTRIRLRQFENDEYMRRMNYQLDVGGKSRIKNLATEHQNKMDVEDNKAKETSESIHVDLERKMEVYWNAYKDTISDYVDHTEERKKEYSRLVSLDAKNSGHISKQIDKIAFLFVRMIINDMSQGYFITDLLKSGTFSFVQRLKNCSCSHTLGFTNNANSKNAVVLGFDTLRRLKERVANVENEQNTKIHDLFNERKVFADGFWTLRTRLKQCKANDDRQLTILSEECNATIDYLMKLYKKGQHVLNAGTVCRKLEKQQEKVLPFRYFHETKRETRASDAELRLNRSAEEPDNELPELERFWTRVGQVNIDRVALQEEREFLKRENQYLKKKIEYYYDSAAYVNPYLDPPKPRHQYKKCNHFELSPINIINAAEIAQNLL